jgi:LuxR family quorum sensing-dependent transcriptional regulator
MLGPETKDRYWGIRALDFVDNIEAAHTPEGVAKLYGESIGELGFHAYIISGLPVAHTNLSDMVLANGWPEEWSAIYMREKLVAYDPVPRHCFRTVEPFEWREAPYDPKNRTAIPFRDAESA